jgi:hypothetical protein
MLSALHGFAKRSCKTDHTLHATLRQRSDYEDAREFAPSRELVPGKSEIGKVTRHCRTPGLPREGSGDESRGLTGHPSHLTNLPSTSAQAWRMSYYPSLVTP